METKPYPQYKESGIQWIGKIPEEWSSHKIKDYLEFDIGGTPPTSHEEYFEGDNVWISIEDLTTNKTIDIKNSKKKISDEAIKKSNVKLIKKGSLLFSFKLTVGETAFAGCDLYTNEAIAAFKQNKNISLNYLKYLLKVGFENNAFENIYGAKIFNSELIKFAKIIKPSFIEQEQIAKYLDNKTTKIQKTITKNKQLITLLKEKRTTLINQTVTKGLNPDVQMKESGIEWIGQIPEHWKLSRLKFNISKKAQYGANKEPEKNDEKLDVRYIRITDIDDNGFLKDSKVYLSKEDAKEFLLNENDILFARSGTVGKAYLHKNNLEKCCFAGYLIRYVPSKTLNSKFLLYFTLSKCYWSWIHYVSTQATIENVSADKYNELILPIPPLIEQENINEYLDNQTKNIDKTIEKVEKNIELLEEYKESLIHHVVTGKIDVRGVEV